MLNWVLERFVFIIEISQVTRRLLESFSFIHLSSISSIHSSCSNLQDVCGFGSIGYESFSSSYMNLSTLFTVPKARKSLSSSLRTAATDSIVCNLLPLILLNIQLHILCPELVFLLWTTNQRGIQSIITKTVGKDFTEQIALSYLPAITLAFRKYGM